MRRAVVAIGFLVACRDKDVPPVRDAAAPSAPEAASSLGESPPPAWEPPPPSTWEPPPLPPFVEDGGKLPAACEGRALSLVAAGIDPRCAISSARWHELKLAADVNAIRQTARRDGARIVLTMENTGPRPLDVPIVVDDRTLGRSVSVYATLDAGLYELAPPTVVWPAGLAADAGPARFHHARIRLPPGGGASLTFVVNPTVVSRLGPHPRVGPEQDFNLRQLPPGRVTLTVGLNVSPLGNGPAPPIEWDAP